MTTSSIARCQVKAPDGISIISDGADAELLALCAQLRAMQAEWQRLWDATPGTEDGGPADQALDAYMLDVWPGIRLSAPRGRHPGESDPAGRLLDLRAITREGLAAKAAAVLAMEEAAAYWGGDFRDDWHDLISSTLRDVAGAAYVPVGEEAHG